MATHSSRNISRHSLISLVLPALLLALGAWQLTRVSGTASGYQARADRVSASMGRLQRVAARDPNTPIQFTGETDSLTPSVALVRMADARATLHRAAVVEEARAAAAWLAVGTAVLALLAAAAGLLAASAGARRGMRSRNDLVRAFRGVVRVLPALLGCVALATALAITGAVLFEVGGFWFLESINTGEIKLALAGLLIAAGALMLAVGSLGKLRRTLAGFTPQPMQVLGRAVSHSEAPGLWACLGEVASRQGAGVPDNIVLGLTEGFFVTQSDVMIAPEERRLVGRTLYLPATMLPLLSRGEVEAVIAHELAHFTGEDTQYTQQFLPLYATMRRSFDAVSGTPRAGAGWEGALAPASSLAEHVFSRFAHTVSHWSRLREFEADHASLRSGRGREAATALIRNIIGSGLVAATLRDVFNNPGRASGDVVGAVVERAGAGGLSNPGRHLEECQPHPTDTHPPTRQRVEALGIAVDASLLAEAGRPVRDSDAAFAAGLFADWPGLCGRLGADVLAVAHERDQRAAAALREAAEAVTQDVELHEAALPIAILLGVVAALSLASALFIVWLQWASGWIEANDAGLLFPITAAVFLVTAAGVGWAAYSRHQRGQAGPFLVVGPEGFSCIGIAGRVDWSDVDGVQVTAGWALITVFHLRPSAPMPAQTGRRWSVKLDPAKRLLTLNGYHPRGMKPQAYLDLLNRALRAHRAKGLLREREAG